MNEFWMVNESIYAEKLEPDGDRGVMLLTLLQGQMLMFPGIV